MKQRQKKQTKKLNIIDNIILWPLGEDNLIFFCTGPTDTNFRQIKIILISHRNIFFTISYRLQ